MLNFQLKLSHIQLAIKILIASLCNFSRVMEENKCEEKFVVLANLEIVDKIIFVAKVGGGCIEYVSQMLVCRVLVTL